ncbi:MAG: LysM peptidoglycan-binding domain-containing protein [Planctomycetota bacterium]|jgi:nucleoid-associated protein YgaU
MTSDAKVGLLLGLVFIFVIAFLINGLPRFSTGSDKNNNELTTNIVSLQNGNLGVDSEKIEIIKQATHPRQRAHYQPAVTVPAAPPQEADLVEPAPKEDNGAESRASAAAAAPVRPAPAVETKGPEKPANAVARRSAFPRVYVVAEGDNLSEIAKKFYGPEEGNRIVNVNKIFEANRKFLKSPDDIKAGQAITIPSLQSHYESGSKIKKFLESSLFEPVKSIGKREVVSKKAAPKRSRQYVVKEGESLWSIAEEQLGDGHRYREIVKLNGDVLEDENVVKAGTRLRVPPR